MVFELMTPIEGAPHPTCNCCPPTRQHLDLKSVLAVGFGSCSVMKGDLCVYDENREPNITGLYWDCQDAENAALADPDHDWRIHFYGPLREHHYQRQAPGHWVLYELGEGFA